VDTINNLLVHEYYRRYISVDSVTTPAGGYKIYFSGSPTSGIYRFQIQEQYQSVSSNSYDIEFKSNILSPTKLLYKFQRVGLTSKKFQNHDATSNSNVYQYSPINDLFLSGYLTKKLVFDFNIGSILYHRDSTYIKKYVPAMEISYEFGTPEYLSIAPYLAYGNYSNDYIHNISILGYGLDMIFSIKSLMFIYFGEQYLHGIGNDINGSGFDLGLKIDVRKILHLLNESKFHKF
jgi:hypothetical protein